MTDSVQQRPRNSRTYGSRRVDPVAVDASDPMKQVSDGAQRSIDALSCRSVMARRDGVTPPPSRSTLSTNSLSPTISDFDFDWKAKLAAIDNGEQDDELSTAEQIPENALRPSLLGIQPSSHAAYLPVHAVGSPSILRTSDLSPNNVASTEASMLSRISMSSPSPPTSPRLQSVVASFSKNPVIESDELCSDSLSDNSAVDDVFQKRARTMKPTKKERIETEKETQRIRAAQDFSIKNRSGWQPKPKSIFSLLPLLTGDSRLDHKREDSDPILPASSSPLGSNMTAIPYSSSGNTALVHDEDEIPSPALSRARPASSHAPQVALHLHSQFDPAGLLDGKGKEQLQEAGNDDEETEFLSAEAILQRVANRKLTKNVKEEALKHLPSLQTELSDDDDLEIEPPPIRRPAGSTAPTRPPILPTSTKSRSHPPLNAALKEFHSYSLRQQIKPSFADSSIEFNRRLGTPPSIPPPRRIRKTADLQALSKTLIGKVHEQAAQERIEKEAEWTKRGGILKDTRVRGPLLPEILGRQAKLEADRLARTGGFAGIDKEGMQTQDSNEEDGEYHPRERSDDDDEENGIENQTACVAAMEESDDEIDGMMDEGDGQSFTEEPSSISQSTTGFSVGDVSLTTLTTPPSSQTSDTKLAEPSQPRLLRPKKLHRNARRIVDDDEDEDHENTVLSSALPSLASPIHDSDAENAQPALDDSDLENVPIAQTRVEQVALDSEDEDAQIDQNEEGRSPLKRLMSFTSTIDLNADREADSAPYGLLFTPTQTQSESVLNQNFPLRQTPMTSSRHGKPLWGFMGGVPRQLSDAETELGDNAADFGFGGLSQLFEGEGQTQSIQNEQPQADGRIVRVAGSFNLATQTSLLLPSVQISEARWKLNNDIFLRQQEEDLLPGSPSVSTPFKMASSSGSVGSQLWTPTKSVQNVLMNPSALRVDLDETPQSRSRNRTQVQIQSLSSLDGTTPTSTSRLKRGRARSTSPAPLPEVGQQSSRSPSPEKQKVKPKNAFDTLMASKGKAKEKIKRSIDRDLVETFMEGEAVESDEEIIFGFDTKNGDDDEDMEEQAGEDGHVKDLVDDQEMDEAVVAKELVLEKVQEHVAEDEARALKIAQDAVDGKLRNGLRKRQSGMAGLDDSDSEDEVDIVRPREKRQRRVKGDPLYQLAVRNPKSMAFVQLYREDLDDDEEYDSHDGGNEAKGTIVGDESSGDDGDEDLPNAQEEREIISTAEIYREVRRRRAEKDKDRAFEEEEFDPDDLAWMQEDVGALDYDELGIEVTPFLRSGGAAPQVQYQTDDMAMWAAHTRASVGALMANSESQAKSFMQSAKSAGSVVNGHGGGAAVTGHANTKKRGQDVLPVKSMSNQKQGRMGPPASTSRKISSMRSTGGSDRSVSSRKVTSRQGSFT